MDVGTVGLIMMIISLCTFVIDGKQWPTFITAAIGGICIGYASNKVGDAVTDTVGSIFAGIRDFIV